MLSVDVVPIQRSNISKREGRTRWQTRQHTMEHPKRMEGRHGEVYQMLKKIFHHGRAMPCALFSKASTSRV